MHRLIDEQQSFWVELCECDYDFAIEIRQAYSTNAKKQLADLKSLEENIASDKLYEAQADSLHKLAGSIKLMGFVTAGQHLGAIESELKLLRLPLTPHSVSLVESQLSIVQGLIDSAICARESK
ncbi:hypothetical protein F9L16_17655 [Agarivorans sp. B2Z047]|uniref:Hpt domain-containing protein n=1 Tax=Agarivorans sp. B2Z047 TaxID=2652721 RepID=UPI00128D8965|nr:Hpt domain-containing protein [Agarivorans sp. B2Z047]MPW30815.1 hypothetical protein [Agarivorans sp. B2Z047]UQN40954.1 Hpt domain-containing protein [Agarivorans sp. B2Z047]